MNVEEMLNIMMLVVVVVVAVVALLVLNKGEPVVEGYEDSAAQNIQMNLGNGKIISKDGSITNLSVWNGLNIHKDSGFTLAGRTMFVVAPFTWNVKLKSTTDERQYYSTDEINKKIEEEGEYWITIGDKKYMPSAGRFVLHTPPNIKNGDLWRLVRMDGFGGSGRNPNAQNGAEKQTPIANGSISIDRLTQVDGTGTWIVEIVSKWGDGRVAMFT